MTEYTITSAKMPGEIRFKYDAKDRLTGFEVTGDLPDELLHRIYKILPTTPAGLTSFKNCKITKQTREITFDDFYTAYGNKVGRKRAETVWKRLSKGKRTAAFDYIETYKSSVIRRGIALKHPSTYLNDEPWND